MGPLVFVFVGCGLVVAGAGLLVLGYLRQKGLSLLPDPWSPFVSIGMVLTGLLVTSKATQRLRRVRSLMKLRAKLLKIGKPVMGNVTALSPHFIYEFPLPNGRKMQAIFDAGEISDGSGLYLGSAIEILYNPANPEESIWSGR